MRRAANTLRAFAALAQPQRVRNDRYGTQAHRQSGDHRREQPAGKRVEDTRRQRTPSAL